MGILQLFDYCLAPDTVGDGTGCDNMTAVIVKFKPDFKLVKDSLDIPQENGVVSPEENSEESNEPASKKMRLDS